MTCKRLKENCSEISYPKQIRTKKIKQITEKPKIKFAGIAEESSDSIWFANTTFWKHCVLRYFVYHQKAPKDWLSQIHQRPFVGGNLDGRLQLVVASLPLHEPWVKMFLLQTCSFCLAFVFPVWGSFQIRKRAFLPFKNNVALACIQQE